MGKYVNTRRIPRSRRPDWTPWEALKKARDYAKGDTRCDHGHDFEGYCAHLSFCVYGMLTSGYASAAALWQGTPRAFKRYDRNPPAGAIACYRGGTYGHAAIVDTFGGIFTNDIHDGRYAAGAYTREKLMSPEWAFGHEYVGWIFPYAAGPEDNRRPPNTVIGDNKQPNRRPRRLKLVDGWFSVDANGGLNIRARPSTNSRVRGRLDDGQNVFCERAVRHEGRTWYHTDAGFWLAAEYLDRNETVAKDRRQDRKYKAHDANDKWNK